jgi:hypothetical protein
MGYTHHNSSIAYGNMIAELAIDFAKNAAFRQKHGLTLPNSEKKISGAIHGMRNNLKQIRCDKTCIKRGPFHADLHV